MNKKVLECSSRGDKRFSALYAKVLAFGINDTIEKHYQRSKRNAARGFVGKGQPVDHMELGNHRYPVAMLTDWYRLLWIRYLDDNPELVEYAKQFDEFTDMFRGKNTINCQADVIRDYIANREQLLQSTKGLLNAIRQARSTEIRMCVNFGENCVGCPMPCIDERRCRSGDCGTCINHDCDNYPKQSVEMYCYAEK